MQTPCLKTCLGYHLYLNIKYSSFLDLIHADDRVHIKSVLTEALKGFNNGEYENEFRIEVLNDNSFKWIKFKGKAYFNNERIAYRLVGTSLDVTIQKILDQATKELLKKKDDFMSIASHELKTPITSLKACLQMLNKMKEKPNSMLITLVDQANKSMERITTLIDNLLSANQLTEGQLHLNKTLFVLSTMIADCSRPIRFAKEYEVIIRGNLNLIVRADANRIDQVVINFVNNAIKYAPESKNIYINIEKIDQRVKVSVSDCGPGIQTDKLEYLFDRFYRIDSAGMQYAGLGLGLYISAEIIKRHNGQIGVESEIDKGSTFWFTLPLD